MATKYPCRPCGKNVTPTKNHRYRSHKNDQTGESCENASEEIPGHLQPVDPSAPEDVPVEGADYAKCPDCGRNAELTKLGYFGPHDKTLRGGDRCPRGGTRIQAEVDGPATATEPTVREELPEPGRSNLKRDPATTSSVPTSTNAGVESFPKEPPQTSGDGTGKSSPGSTTTSSTSDKSPDAPGTSSDAPGPPEEPVSADSDLPAPFPVGPAVSDAFSQPLSPFFQPFEIPPTVKTREAMSDRGKQIADRLRETFYAYTNRNSSDNRSAQRTLGPSEAGSPCDRQIAMKLLGITPVNPQEGWAPFVGTAVHAELAKMFEWANGSGSGRYVVEMPLSFGNPYVPRGTGDLLDRVLFMFLDHKLMGRYSLKKLVEQGPGDTYRTQVQIYGLGATLAGEKVREVAIVGWPRQESSLDNLYVHVEPFDRKLAEAALDRVARIASQVRDRSGDQNAMRVAQSFETGDDCKWCDFHLKGDKGFNRGCPGQ